MAEIFSYINPLSNLTGIAKPDGSFKLYSEQLSSMNFDGVATKKQIKTKVSDLKTGQTVLISDASYSSTSAFITKIESRDGFINDDPLQPVVKYYIYYLSEFSMEQPFTYNAVYGDSYDANTELYVLRDDTDNFVLGNDGWTLTNNGNAIFSNIFARGTIEATSGKIDGNLKVGTNPIGGPLVTIGSDLFDGKSFESVAEKHSGILLDVNNYLLSYPAITQVPVTSVVVTNSSISGSLYSATFTIPLGAGEVNTLQVGDFVKLSGFTHANTIALNDTHQVSAVTATTFTIPISYNINLTSPVSINVSVTSFALIKTYNLTSMALASTSDTINNSNVKIYLNDSDFFSVGTEITLESFLGNLLSLNGVFRIVAQGSGYIEVYSKRITAGTYTSSLGSIILYSKVQKFKVGDNFNFMSFSSETGSLKLTGTINAHSGNFINQVYVGQAATTFYIYRKKLASNIATLSTTQPHSFIIGDIVTVVGVDATFNGTYTVKATPTATTFTYDKTASPVAEIDLVDFGYVSSDSSVDGTIKVGVADTGITIDGTGDPLTSAIYAGEGNYYNVDTPFFMDASGRFSISNKLKFDGSNLTIAGTVTANAFAIDANNYWNTTGNEGDFRVGSATSYLFWNQTNSPAAGDGSLQVKGTVYATAGIFSGNIQTTGKIYSGTLDGGGLLTSGIELAVTGIKGIVNGITAFNLPADGVTAPTITNFDILNAKITGSGANAYLIAGTVSNNITVRGDRTGVDATGAIFNTVSNIPTTYASGTGFYFNESGTFRFGTPTKYIRWDGNNLDITGDVRIGATPASTVVSNASAGVAKPDVYRQISAPGSGYDSTTSIQSMTFGTGPKNFGNIGNIGSFIVGDRVRAENSVNPTTQWLEGLITAIVNVGPSLWYFTINVDSFSGTGSVTASWKIKLTNPIVLKTGSIWYDTDDNNKTYVYDGTTWVATETNAAGVGLGNVSNLTPQNQAQTGLIAGTTITGGGITLSSGGNIKGGQTAFNTGTGFFLGYDSTTYKFSIGDSSANKLIWNGSLLSVTGEINATSGTFTGITISGGSGSSKTFLESAASPSITVNVTGSVNGSTLSAGSGVNFITSGFFVGMFISGTGIPGATYIKSLTASVITLSQSLIDNCSSITGYKYAFSTGGSTLQTGLFAVDYKGNIKSTTGTFGRFRVNEYGFSGDSDPAGWASFGKTSISLDTTGSYPGLYITSDKTSGGFLSSISLDRYGISVFGEYSLSATSISANASSGVTIQMGTTDAAVGYPDGGDFTVLSGQGNELIIAGSPYSGGVGGATMPKFANFVENTLQVNGIYYDASSNQQPAQVFVNGQLFASNWFRATGSTGLYFQNWDGGWHMTDATWIRAYKDKAVYTAGVMRADGGFQGNATSATNAGSYGTMTWAGGATGFNFTVTHNRGTNGVLVATAQNATYDIVCTIRSVSSTTAVIQGFSRSGSTISGSTKLHWMAMN